MTQRGKETSLGSPSMNDRAMLEGDSPTGPQSCIVVHSVKMQPTGSMDQSQL